MRGRSDRTRPPMSLSTTPSQPDSLVSLEDMDQLGECTEACTQACLDRGCFRPSSGLAAWAGLLLRRPCLDVFACRTLLCRTTAASRVPACPDALDARCTPMQATSSWRRHACAAGRLSRTWARQPSCGWGPRLHQCSCRGGRGQVEGAPRSALEQDRRPCARPRLCPRRHHAQHHRSPVGLPACSKLPGSRLSQTAPRVRCRHCTSSCSRGSWTRWCGCPGRGASSWSGM